MRKTKIFIVIVLVILGIVLAVYGAIKLFRPQVSGINIISTPASSVYINEEQKGRTPYKENLPPGEIVLRLIPDSFDTPLEPYDTKINLVGGIETVVKYNFAPDVEKSSGEIISFEKNATDETSIVVVSIPDFINVVIDNTERSTTPFKTSSITPGVHSVSLFAEGYETQNTQIKAYEGYKLTLIVKLAKSEIVPVEVELPAEPAEVPEVEVEILPTSVGYLRVRSKPSTLSDEVGRVDPGKRYKYLEEDEDTGWFNIEFTDGEETKSGWVSNQYAKKIENIAVSPTVTPSNTLTPTLTQ